MINTLAIAIGGASGALLRYWVSNGVYAWLGRGFPWGTLSVNILGSLTMGVLYVLFLERVEIAQEWRSGLLVGLLGAFTTFSTFSMDTVNLIEQGEAIRAVLNIFVSVIACVGAAWLGVILARQL